MAAAVLPLVAAVGAAIDISRDYMAKSRLQQACDAGVLAGRKAQGGTLFGSDAETEAREFFAINYPDGLYGAQDVVFTPTSSITNEVSGTATAFLPSTLGHVIGYQGASLAVDCVARLDLTNTDVMFVLDSSGSMAEGSGTPGVTRIAALKQAVRDFHEVLESAKRPDTQIRYGFVAYTSTVNVGALLTPLSPNAVDSTYEYHTRRWVDGSRTLASGSPLAPNQTECQYNYGTWNSAARTCTVPGWYVHRRLSLNVTSLRSGNSIKNLAERDQRPLSWSGCIEERQTVAAADFDPIPAEALDLDPDTDGGSTDPQEWRLQLDAAYRRDGAADQTFLERRSNDRRSGAQCPRAKGQLVRTMSAGDVDAYVNTLSAGGSTYHDLGMIWGLRLISPTGLWASRNTSSPNGLPIARHIIFMTDGQMSTQDDDYSAYGLERHDERVGGGEHTKNDLVARHNARFLAMCDLAKKQYDIHVWTIAFGEPLSNTRLVECADTGRSFEANDADELNDTFRRIATRIADLRLEQ